MAKAAGRVVGRFREGLLPWDTSPGVLIPRPEELREKLSHFESSKMHIVADFDYTLTRAWHPSGERGVSSHLLVQRNPAFGEHFRERSNALFNKFHPIEIDDSVSHEEKTAAMVEWWEGAHDLMIEAKVCRHDFEDMVKSPTMGLREHTADFFTLATEQNIPLHVFSAGLGDVIEAGFREWGVPGSYSILSNMMEFGDDGIVTRFQEPLIHTLVKCGSMLKSTREYATIANRKSILLLGDQPGDCRMGEGIDAERVVRVAFLNDRVEERKDLFLEMFDVVLVAQDGVQPGMEYPLSLLAHIAAHSARDES